MSNVFFPTEPVERAQMSREEQVALGVLEGVVSFWKSLVSFYNFLCVVFFEWEGL